MKIRQETKNDYKAVYNVVSESFKMAECADGDEQDLVVKLRQGMSFIPELSLVAEEDGVIVGHIMFTKAKICDSVQLVLAPVAVLPSWQGKGIGSKIIEEGHRIARELGYEFSILTGHADYYPRFGYKPASQFGIRVSFEIADENFLAINLLGKDTKFYGVLEFAKEFGIE